MEILTPIQVWDGFDPLAEELEEEQVADGLFTFVAKHCFDGKITVQMREYKPAYDSRKVILVAQDYSRKVQQCVIDDLVKRGFVVFVPDYSAIEEDTKTSFPSSYAYGKYEFCGEHLRKVCPTARETSQFIYTLILRRAVTAIKEIRGYNEIAVMGIGGGAEISMILAGVDKRLLSLVCINGVGYSEYTNANKYGSNKEIDIDDALMAWLTGVSSVAYAKHITIPTLFAIGSNSNNCDMDRIINVFAVFGTEDVRLVVSPRCIDNIDREAYGTVTNFLESSFVYSHLPKLPSLSLETTKEGVIYASVVADNCIKIQGVTVYYSYGDYNHTTRNWEEATGEATGVNEFIAPVIVNEKDAPLFVMAQVKYLNGTVVTSLLNYSELKEEEIILSKNTAVSPIIYQFGRIGNFSEQIDGDVIYNSTLTTAEIPVGLKGIKSAGGHLVTFSVGALKTFDNDKLLQLDVYNEEKEYSLKVSLLSGDRTARLFSASSWVETEETFSSVRLEVDDFHDVETLKPLESWKDVKAIRIEKSDTVVGKILLI